MDREKPINMEALQLSPFSWYEAISWGIAISDGYAELLLPKLNFKDWLMNGELEHPTLNFSPHHAEDLVRMNTGTFANTYYHKVGFINEFGAKQIRSTIEELKTVQFYNNAEHFYVFRVHALNHFISFHFQNWHLLNSDFHWSRWRMFYDFIVNETDEILGGLFQRMWYSTFRRIDITSRTFKNIEQYKRFRDELEEIDENSKFIETRYIELRDKKHKS